MLTPDTVETQAISLSNPTLSTDLMRPNLLPRARPMHTNFKSKLVVLCSLTGMRLEIEIAELCHTRVQPRKMHERF